MEDLKAKLEQTDDCIQALREVKSKIVQQMADTELCSIGDRFKMIDSGLDHILVYGGSALPDTVALIDLNDGSCWTSGKKVKDRYKITKAEMVSVFGCRTFIRYDARKQCKC